MVVNKVAWKVELSAASKETLKVVTRVLLLASWWVVLMAVW